MPAFTYSATTVIITCCELSQVRTYMKRAAGAEYRGLVVYRGVARNLFWEGIKVFWGV